MSAARAFFRALIVLALAGSALQAQDVWTRANAATLRLPPSQFPALPSPVRRDLERRACRIPQSSLMTTPSAPHNVIHGAFTGARLNDWAVLCSIRDTSQILLYHDNGAAAVDSLAKAADYVFLQGAGGDRIAFSRKISIATAASIREHAEAYDGPKPPSVLDHVGIDDAFLGKASVILYKFGGKWLALQGADLP